jgi:acyl-CoA reductase-like NAD-dependent aldehyde dehydrogenase
MAIKIQGTTIINDETSYVSLAGTGGLKLPVGTTAERELFTPVAGVIRFNSTDTALETYDGSAWNPVGGADEYARTIALLGL